MVLVVSVKTGEPWLPPLLLFLNRLFVFFTQFSIRCLDIQPHIQYVTCLADHNFWRLSLPEGRYTAT